MADALSFKFDGKALLDGLDTVLGTKFRAAALMYAETAAADLEAYMKQHRPWTDRTGMAKARLSGSVQKVQEGLRIALAHGVDYGIWLELANEKRFAIIQPTIQAKSGDVLKGFARLMDRVKK